LAPSIVGFATHHPEMGLIFGTLWLGMSSFGFLFPRFLIRRWATHPVTVQEVDSLLNGREDSLERAFLTLVRDALNQGVPETVDKEVRNAIRALAVAIERLPPLTASGDVDTNRLLEEAERVQQAAANETDTVTAASLLRQSEALLRSAQAAERAAVALRRNAALRQEIAAQTEALRLGLASLYSGSGDTGELVRLAEQVQAIANDANAVVDARTELEEFLCQPSAMKNVTAESEPSTTSVVNSMASSTATTVQLSARK
jgi:hypothetical protein